MSTTYNQPIPPVVLLQIPALVAGITDVPFEVRISSFPADEGGLLFGLDVSYKPRAVKVRDRRQNDYLICERMEVYLRPDGTEDGRTHFPHQRVSGLSGTGAYEVVTEDQIDEEKAALR